MLYRETHNLLEEIAEATIDGTRKQHMELLTTVPLLIIDDLGMRKLPSTAAEDLLEIVMRRYERTCSAGWDFPFLRSRAAEFVQLVNNVPLSP